MAARSRLNRYSRRGWIFAGFIVAATVLGGGGSPSPATELLLEVVFCAVVLAWVWLEAPRGLRGTGPAVWIVCLIVLSIPVFQLIPLPPSIWRALPGREAELAALSLVGAESTWRPLSMSPSRTLASLLSMVPAVFCFAGVAALNRHDRRLLLLAIVLMAIVTALLGSVQLTARGYGFNMYPVHHVGWITGFQANRNAAADVLLIGLVALAALAAPYFSGLRKSLPLNLDPRPVIALFVVLALLLMAATVMTGSRTGTVLILVAIFGGLVILQVERAVPSRALVIATSLGVVTLAVALFLTFSDMSAIGRTADRFSEVSGDRAKIWEDTRFAIAQYWPVGFGIGGFEPAMLPAEQLQYLDASVPNRAHNDYLEIGLESGLLGYLQLAALALTGIVVFVRSWWGSPENRGQLAFSICVLIIVALHSIVDYPLRSMALACLTGAAAGLLSPVRQSGPVSKPEANHLGGKGL